MKSGLALLLVGACTQQASAAGEAFNYDDQAAWADIIYADAGSNHCGLDANSPIDIPAEIAGTCTENTEGIILVPGDCTVADMKFTSNDHGVKAEFVGDCTKPSAKFPDYDETFIAAQFHIHTSCEHNVAGEGCDAELHIVHFSDDTDFADPTTYKAAVVGMMVSNDATEPQPALESMLQCWSAERNDFVSQCVTGDCETANMYTTPESTCDDGAFDIYGLIPEGSGYYNYMGGLTTPPCTQIVRWNLMDTKVSITLNQWSMLANLILNYGGYVDEAGACVEGKTVASLTGSTSRKTQAINGREIKHRCNAVL